jgi:hypothetical protein
MLCRLETNQHTLKPVDRWYLYCSTYRPASLFGINTNAK